MSYLFRTGPRRGRRAFTLIELLVAVAVLAMMSVLLGQVLSAVSQTWHSGQARANNFSKGRSMLDLLARDLQSGIYRSDLPAFPNGSTAFYTLRPGFSSGGGAVRAVSWTEYDLGALTNTILQRADLAVNWSSSPAFGQTDAPDGAIPRDTAPGVVGFTIQFVYPDGTLSTNYVATNRPKAASIGLAVIDDKTLEILSKTPSKISSLRGGFASSVSGTNSLKVDWENHLKNGVNWSDYPKNMASGLKIFERYVPLP